MAENQSVIVDLSISPEQWQSYYSGAVKTVQAYSVEGRSLHFPARILHTMLLADGIHGRFRIEFSSQGKFVGISRV
ncbi:MAG: DUF2835 domain-containing protein [Oceanobacter sp.]